MLYVSPFQIFEKANLKLPDGLASGDAAAFALARKVILAEMEARQLTTIRVGDRELDRDGILKHFDALVGSNAGLFHAQIAAEPAFLAFLSEAKLPEDASFFEKDQFKTLDFQAFVAPFFGAAYAQAVDDRFATPEFSEVKKLLVLPAWGRETARGELLKVIRKKDKALRNAIPNAATAKRKNLEAQFFSPALIDLFLALGWAFASQRAQYGQGLLQLSAQLFNSGRQDDARYILRRVEQLDAEKALARDVADLEYQFDFGQKGQKQQPASGGGGCQPGVWQIILFIVLAIRMLAQVGQCNSSNRSRTAYDRGSNYNIEQILRDQRKMQSQTVESVELGNAVLKNQLAKEPLAKSELKKLEKDEKRWRQKFAPRLAADSLAARLAQIQMAVSIQKAAKKGGPVNAPSVVDSSSIRARARQMEQLRERAKNDPMLQKMLDQLEEAKRIRNEVGKIREAETVVEPPKNR